MTTHASCTFEVKSWDEKTYDEVDGRLKLTRAAVTFAYHGDLEGLGAITYLMAYRDDGSATVVGLERVSGKLGGKEGTFVLEHHGSYADGTARGELHVVEGSATGGLEGLCAARGPRSPNRTERRQSPSTTTTLSGMVTITPEGTQWEATG